MTFEAYIENIRKKTGMTPVQIHAAAKRAGIAGPDLTASRLVAWLKQEYGLGHGHSMAIWAVFKSKGLVQPPKKRK